MFFFEARRGRGICVHLSIPGPNWNFECEHHVGGHQVESSSFCQAVIRCRMDDKLIRKAAIFPDVTTFTPTGDLLKCEGYTLGFPCQAVGETPHCSLAVGVGETPHLFCLSIMFSGQGVARCGRGEGLFDPRTGLIKELFRLLDLTPSA